jgi:HK97 gp10 family phage protein
LSGGHVTMKVEGLRELEAALVKLEKGMPAILAKALKTPMEQVLEDAKALVPEDTGALRDALDLTPVRRASWRRASMADTLSEVGLKLKRTWGPEGNRPRSYWHLVEFGTAHSAPQSFIRAAFDMNAARLLSGFTSITRAELDKIHARHARKRRRSPHAPTGWGSR